MYNYYCLLCPWFIIISILCFSGESWAAYNYYISSDMANFFQAIVNCQEGGTQLASITNVNEAIVLNDTLQSLLQEDKSHNLWLSGTNLLNTSSTDYYWFTGGQEVNFTMWFPGEPNNASGIEHCLTWVQKSKSNVGWNDLRCSAILPYICQQYFDD